MAAGATLVLGFLGNDLVDTRSAIPLIEDLITAHRRNHKQATIVFLMCLNRLTGPQDALIDHALTSGYKVGLVAHSTFLDHPDTQRLLADAAGNINRISATTLIGRGLISVLAGWENSGTAETRVILMADPNGEDEWDAYAALESAHDFNIDNASTSGRKIRVRSLLYGLDEVTLPAEPDIEETSVMPLNPEDFDDDNLDDELEPAEADFDDDTLVDDPELVSDDDDLDGDLPPESTLVEDDDDPEPDSLTKDVEDEELPVEGSAEPEEEHGVGNDPGTASDSEEDMAENKWTVERLTRLSEKDRPGLYELAAQHQVFPGRGVKASTMITRILAAQDGVAPPPKQAPAKKAKKAPVKKAPVKKAPVKKVAKAVAPVEAAAIPSVEVLDVAPVAPVKPVKAPAKAPVVHTSPIGDLSNTDVKRLAKAVVKELAIVLRKGLSS